VNAEMNLLIIFKSGIYSLTERQGGGRLATGCMVRSSNAGGDKRFYLFLTLPDRAWCRPSLLYNGYRLPGRGVDHPPLPSAKVKNEWSYTYSPPLFLLWYVVGLSAERMLASKEAFPLGLHYYYC
jgi:hypothetical protein